MGEREERAAAQAIDSALRVHRHLGPGLLEGVYEACLVYELAKRAIETNRQLAVAVKYDGLTIDGGFRVDLLVDRCLVVEIKSVDAVLPVHRAQLLSYLRLGDFKLGLLINFNVPRLADGTRRMVNDRALRNSTGSTYE